MPKESSAVKKKGAASDGRPKQFGKYNPWDPNSYATGRMGEGVPVRCAVVDAWYGPSSFPSGKHRLSTFLQLQPHPSSGFEATFEKDGQTLPRVVKYAAGFLGSTVPSNDENAIDDDPEVRAEAEPAGGTWSDYMKLQEGKLRLTADEEPEWRGEYLLGAPPKKTEEWSRVALDMVESGFTPSGPSIKTLIGLDADWLLVAFEESGGKKGASGIIEEKTDADGNKKEPWKTLTVVDVHGIAEVEDGEVVTWAGEEGEEKKKSSKKASPVAAAKEKAAAKKSKPAPVEEEEEEDEDVEDDDDEETETEGDDPIQAALRPKIVEFLAANGGKTSDQMLTSKIYPAMAKLYKDKADKNRVMTLLSSPDWGGDDWTYKNGKLTAT